MVEQPDKRNPPAICFIPPPESPRPLRDQVRDPLVACLIGIALMAIIAFYCGYGWKMWIGATATLLVIAGIVVAIAAWVQSERHWKARNRFETENGSLTPEPPADRLQAAWKIAGKEPDIKDTLAVLASPDVGVPADSALILCYGIGCAPEIGDDHFEAEIVTPSGLLWRRLIFVPVAALLVSWIALDRIAILPSFIPPTSALFSGMAYFLVAGATALAVWIWKGMVRPTYVRMAPGVIQVLRYRMGRSKPDINSFEMTSGTVAMLVGLPKRTTLMLLRGTQQEKIELSAMRNSKARIKTAWRSLLSTAPIPPLSDEELVG